MAKYRIELRWNDKIVLEGTASAVVPWQNLKRLMIDNFTGETRIGAEPMVPSLSTLLLVEIGRVFRGRVSDATGSAQFEVERIE